MSYLVGSGLTPYGKHEGSSTLGLMSQASNLALKDSGLLRSDIDGVICGYSTTMPHLDRKSTRLNSSHMSESRMPSSA